MKNHQIRAMRTDGRTVSAPEYAVNCLKVDVMFAKGRTDVREMSVRLWLPGNHLRIRSYVFGISRFPHRMPGQAERIGRLFI